MTANEKGNQSSSSLFLASVLLLSAISLSLSLSLSSIATTEELRQKTIFNYYSANDSHTMDSQTQEDTTTTLAVVVVSDGEHSTASHGASHGASSSSSSSSAAAAAAACKLKAIDARISEKISSKLNEDQISLLEYQLTFPNHSVNPLSAISWRAYRLDSWARASSRHGQTLLSLLFNYGILSLRTLTFGTDLLTVEMHDVPGGCAASAAALNETEAVAQLLFLLSRDFRDTADEVTLKGEERICHEVIDDVSGYAKFTDRCFQKGTNGELVETEAGNFWINLLYVLLSLVRFAILFFGPLLLTSSVARMSDKSFRYVVKLKEALRKTVRLTTTNSRSREPKSEDHPKLLDLSSVQGFPKFAESIANLPRDETLEVQISQYDIMVDYKRLLTENRVPVSLWKSLGRMMFLCEIRKVGPFKRCCKANIWKSWPRRSRSRRPVTPCSYIWRKVGIVLLIAFIPTPWYLRLWVFYEYEYSEVLSRKQATAKLGLKEGFDNSLIHFFTPEHWLFRCIYVLYFVSAITLAYVVRRGDKRGFRRIVTDSFSDLESLSWIRVLEMLVGNIVWPFERFGLCGLLVAGVYWPLVIPLSLIVFAVYILPLTYLVVRMLCHSNPRKTESTEGDQTEREEAMTIRSFEASFYFSKDRRGDHSKKRRNDSKCGDLDGTFWVRSMASVLWILSLVSYLVIMSECIGCAVEIAVFTLMGIIVNAGTLLKYVTLLILVVVYSYDSFNNVEKKYLKLNKALFSEVKGRIKDLDKVTSLPSHLQENRGFKSQELNEQGDYELPDDLDLNKAGQADQRAPQWMINDLVLFVDSEDMPRIPEKLFDEVCQIRVAGVPGPVYSGLLFAVRQFLKIALFIAFVFVVVLSFGDVYKISSTNQMLATLAGGFLPVILRQFMEPERPDIEIGTVSFKSKLDEIIKNFKQPWPIHDFPLEKRTNEEPEKKEEEKMAADEEENKHSNGDATEQTGLLNKDRNTTQQQWNTNGTTEQKGTSVESSIDWLIKCPTEITTNTSNDVSLDMKLSPLEEV